MNTVVDLTFIYQLQKLRREISSLSFKLQPNTQLSGES
jgi:hypothetical protein